MTDRRSRKRTLNGRCDNRDADSDEGEQECAPLRRLTPEELQKQGIKILSCRRNTNNSTPNSATTAQQQIETPKVNPFQALAKLSEEAKKPAEEFKFGSGFTSLQGKNTDGDVSGNKPGMFSFSFEGNKDVAKSFSFGAGLRGTEKALEQKPDPLRFTFGTPAEMKKTEGVSSLSAVNVGTEKKIAPLNCFFGDFTVRSIEKIADESNTKNNDNNDTESNSKEEPKFKFSFGGGSLSASRFATSFGNAMLAKDNGNTTTMRTGTEEDANKSSPEHPTPEIEDLQLPIGRQKNALANAKTINASSNQDYTVLYITKDCKIFLAGPDKAWHERGVGDVRVIEKQGVVALTASMVGTMANILNVRMDATFSVGKVTGTQVTIRTIFLDENGVIKPELYLIKVGKGEEETAKFVEKLKEILASHKERRGGK